MSKLRSLCQPVSIETYRGDSVLRDIAERNLQVSAEIVFDVGNHIIAAMGWKSPENYQEVLEILAQHQVLSSKLAAALSGLAGFRNVLVHEYLTVDHQIVYAVLQNNLEYLEDFSKSVVNFMDELSEEEK